ncbi:MULTISPECIES: hypothetical protein [Hyphobacterium]|uniref:Auto-transporter adhesin head GIN domain-containing protein n=1 Tax=Hyphobacterium vulgare TaxID=1736751 RepID=A0ABV6ZT14_9PROT
MRTLSLGAAALAMFSTAGCMDVAVAHSTGVSHAQSMAIGGNMNRTLDQDGDLSLIGGHMDLRGRVGGDVNLVGGNIDLDLDIGGELSVAGGDLDVSGTIGRKAEIAGGDITWQAEVMDDLEIAGGNLVIDARIARNLEAASGELEILEGAEIGGNAELAAANIRFDGRVAGTLEAFAAFLLVRGQVDGGARLMADPHERRGLSWRAEVDEDGARAGNPEGRVELAGDMGGAVEVCARRVDILRNARIAGPLRVWADAEPEISNEASIGDLVYEARNGRDCDDIFDDLERL